LRGRRGRERVACHGVRLECIMLVVGVRNRGIGISEIEGELGLKYQVDRAKNARRFANVEKG